MYDASPKTKKGNLSLNECLYRGTVILEDLRAHLMRFRSHKVILVADIEKAFLQVGLQIKDRDATRFLCLKDITKPVTTENIVVLTFTRIPFGVISSQFILAATIVHHLMEKGTAVSKKIEKDIYVDNMITGTNTERSAMQIYLKGKEIFQEMSMNLREWTSNSITLRRNFKEKEKYHGKDIEVLGIHWDIYDDQISIPMKGCATGGIYNKRQILKETAEVFNPLGYFSPALINAKLLLRDLWKNNLDWDEMITPEQIDCWKNIQKNLQLISNVKLPRFIENNQCELLCFSDASGKVFGTTIYLRYIKENHISTNLIFSKSRIAPNKELSMP